MRDRVEEAGVTERSLRACCKPDACGSHEGRRRVELGKLKLQGSLGASLASTCKSLRVPIGGRSGQDPALPDQPPTVLGHRSSAGSSPRGAGLQGEGAAL